MPTKKSTKGKKSGTKGSVKTSLTIGSVEDGEGDFADPPIVVQGGGSIEMDVPPKFKEKSQSLEGKKFKNEFGDLDSVVIDDAVTIKLKPTSRIVINYT